MMKRPLVVSIVSGKGGVGKTSIATNLAYIIAKHYRLKTLLIDANITTPHIGTFTSLHPSGIDLNTLLTSPEVKVSIEQTSDNFYVLHSRFFSQERDYRRVVNLRRVIEGLKDFDVIIVDSAPGIGREALSSIMASDVCLIVATPTAASVSDVLRLKKVLDELKVKEYSIVLNMVGFEDKELKVDDVEYITGIPVILSIGYEKSMDVYLNAGELYAEANLSSKFSKKLKKLAYELLYKNFPSIDQHLSLIERLKRRLKGLRRQRRGGAQLQV